MRVVWLALCVLGVGACGDSFSPVYWLREPRLIAVTADPPELPRLAKATLTAVVADPSGSGAATFRWWRCDRAAIAGVDGDVSPDCMRDDPNVDYLVSLGSGASVEVVMPDVEPATLGVPDYTLGVYVPIRVDMQVGERIEKIVYRLRQQVPTSTPANTNPAFVGLFQSRAEAGKDAGTDDVAALPSEEPLTTIGLDDELRLRARFADGSSEELRVVAVADDGTPSQEISKESLRVSWFTTYGELSSAATGDDTDTTLSFRDETRRPPAPVPEAGAIVDLWAVGRDERGGTTVSRGRVRVVPGTVP